MIKKNKIFIPCDEANHVCDKNQYKEATLWEMIKLNIHLIYCGVCRKYTANNGKLTKAIKKGEVDFIDASTKSSMKKDFEKALKELNN